MASDISLITSIYNAAHFLESYCASVIQVARKVQEAGLRLEIILVLNKPSLEEQTHVEKLVRASERGTFTVRALTVPRETLYASWNRGIVASSGHVLGFWNVDDQRTAEGLIEGYHLIKQGCSIVDFPFFVVRRRTWSRIGFEQSRWHPVQYDPTSLSSKQCTGPFFLFAPDLYCKAGPFDERFTIMGDFEWVKRDIIRATRFCPGTAIGGYFVMHGSNLSNVRNPLEDVEVNIVFLRHAAYDHLRPVDPILMRKRWEETGGGMLSPELEERLWGVHAYETWQQWLAERRRIDRSEKLRTIPRILINRTGLRPTLAKLGVVRTRTVQQQYPVRYRLFFNR